MTDLTAYALLVTVALLTGIGQTLFKRVARRSLSLGAKIRTPAFLAGALCFLAGPLLSSIAARRIDFAVLYAMTSLNLLFVLLLARLFLGERVDARKIAGVVTILAGLLVMTRPL